MVVVSVQDPRKSVTVTGEVRSVLRPRRPVGTSGEGTPRPVSVLVRVGTKGTGPGGSPGGQVAPGTTRVDPGPGQSMNDVGTVMGRVGPFRVTGPGWSRVSTLTDPSLNSQLSANDSCLIPSP